MDEKIVNHDLHKNHYPGQFNQIRWAFQYNILVLFMKNKF